MFWSLAYWSYLIKLGTTTCMTLFFCKYITAFLLTCTHGHRNVSIESEWGKNWYTHNKNMWYAITSGSLRGIQAFEETNKDNEKRKTTKNTFYNNPSQKHSKLSSSYVLGGNFEQNSLKENANTTLKKKRRKKTGIETPRLALKASQWTEAINIFMQQCNEVTQN